VTGGLAFVDISAGVNHTCGIAAGGQAYCWGLNVNGQLGAEQPDFTSAEPVPVSGGHSFSSISAGNEYTCGIAQETTARGNTVAYCWGSNAFGQIGIIGWSGVGPIPVTYQF
jgi:alpha-tubulin suppressor-like RCC1 family protein